MARRNLLLKCDAEWNRGTQGKVSSLQLEILKERNLIHPWIPHIDFCLTCTHSVCLIRRAFSFLLLGSIFYSLQVPKSNRFHKAFPDSPNHHQTSLLWTCTNNARSPLPLSIAQFHSILPCRLVEKYSLEVHRPTSESNSMCYLSFWTSSWGGYEDTLKT